MSDKPFKVGDVVGLKSGSPALTVSEVSQRFDDGWQVGVTWFSDPGFESSVFIAEMLEPFDDLEHEDD